VDNRTHLIERAAARIRAFPESVIPLTDGSRSGTTLRHVAIDPAERRTAPTPEPTRDRITQEALAQAGLVSWEARDRRVAEEFRVIQHKILRQTFSANGTALEAGGNAVMVTSARQGEGKSFCAINLTGEIARQGDRKVLLVDTDPNPKGLASRLGVSEERGLLDLARGRYNDMDALTIQTEADNLEFLPFGSNAQGSAELFASRRMAETIEAICRFDPDRLVIFDAPPCLGSSTPHTLAGVVGQITLVVAAGDTQRSDVEAALELLQANSNVSVLLNKAPVWSAPAFVSYGSAGRS